RQHAEEQANPRLHVQLTVVAVDVDVLTLDVLEDEIWLTTWGDARVDQMRDRRMGQPRENRALADEALLAGAADERGIQELHRVGTFDPAVAAPGQPHAAHSARANRRHERVGPNHLAGKRWMARMPRRRAVEESRAIEIPMFSQQHPEIGGDRRLTPRQV